MSPPRKNRGCVSLPGARAVQSQGLEGGVGMWQGGGNSLPPRAQCAAGEP